MKLSYSICLRKTYSRNCDSYGKSVSESLKEQEIELHLTEGAIAAIADKGFDREYGARPLRRAIQKHVEDRLSEELLKGAIEKGQKVIFDVEGKHLSFIVLKR